MALTETLGEDERDPLVKSEGGSAGVAQPILSFFVVFSVNSVCV